VRHGALVVGGLLTGLLVGVALGVPAMAGRLGESATRIDLSRKLELPSRAHWLGTDELGRDVTGRVLMGARISLAGGLGIVALTAAIGVPLGLLSGYYPARLGEVIMRVADLFLAVPYIPLAMALAAALGPSLVNAVIAAATPWWPWYARVIRAEVLSLRERAFVDAARALGCSTPRILVRHILPACVPLILVQATLQVGLAILTLAALSFLGLGPRPPVPELGLMIALARNFLPDWWWLTVAPGVAIALSVFAFNLLGDGLRDWLDPRLSGATHA
jgi:peptide/nickel transport system permease protein